MVVLSDKGTATPCPFFAWDVAMTEMTTAAPKKKTRVRYLTASEKAEAIALWKSGTVTLDDLAKRFKKDRGTFVRLFKSSGVEKGETEVETRKKVAEAVTDVIINDATILAKRIKDTKEDHYRYVTGVSLLAWNVIVKAQRESRVPGTFAADMKALEMAMRVFKMSREEKYALLGINAEDDNDDKPLPDLVVQELSSDDIQRLHEQSLMADDELGLNEELGDEELIAEVLDDEDERVEED